MNRYRETFPNRHVVLPVIHVENREQTLRNAEIAHRQGCDGVFLINHDAPYTKLLEIHHLVYEAFPDWWIGVNCLDLDPSEVFESVSENSIYGPEA